MMSKPLTIREFFKQFPDDETCLQHLFDVRFGQGHSCPSCERPSNWYRIKAERAYSCQWCGYHLHVTVGTPFEKTRTPLQLWFYAIFLFTTTRNGVAAKELQRQLGVTYKTAWRMAGLIREHMAAVDGDERLGGEGKIVEIDETLIGGNKRKGWSHARREKTMVMGLLVRDGEVQTTIVADNRKHTLLPEVSKRVQIGTVIHTDELHSYKGVREMGFEHHTVSHARGVYVGPTGGHVQGIENFWAQLKRMVGGTHIHVSAKHLWKYAKEAEYRFNRRDNPSAMLPELLSTFRPAPGERLP